MLELRRRVQADPASIAFAQLAEECRRRGDTDEAVNICRAGLQFHPDYLSARVTLGRALTELFRLDEAEAELQRVLQSAPDNLPANRALAEVYQKRGQMPEALRLYRKALELARFDPDLEEEVHRVESVVMPPPPEPEQPPPAAAVEDLFDFDTLLEQLGGRTQPRLKFDLPAPGSAATPAITPLTDVPPLPADDGDPFSVLERQLRDVEEQRPVQAPLSEEELREQRVLDELEEWLSAIVSDRDNRPIA